MKALDRVALAGLGAEGAIALFYGQERPMTFPPLLIPPTSRIHLDHPACEQHHARAPRDGLWNQVSTAVAIASFAHRREDRCSCTHWTG